MSLHKYDLSMKPDSDFIQGEFALLVEDNACRLLDGRRTTGYIENVSKTDGMFRWRITKYEDEGRCWDLPMEDVSKFQFEKDAKKLEKATVEKLTKIVKNYAKVISIFAADKEKEISEYEIRVEKENALNWINDYSVFFRSNEVMDFNQSNCSVLLARDFKNYMKHVGCEKEEQITADNIVLNPSSGEWILGLRIVLAEMGLNPYTGRIPRTKDIFEGIGNKQNRRKYIIHRLAFMRAYFSQMNKEEVVLYRGMCSEKNWHSMSRTFLNMTFSRDVAEAFSNFDPGSKYRISYLVKMTIPVEKLFMTYLETEEMNQKYKESEALVLYDDEVVL